MDRGKHMPVQVVASDLALVTEPVYEPMERLDGPFPGVSVGGC